MATTPPATNASASAPQPVPEPVVTCDESKAQWAVGKLADEALQAKVINDSGATKLRLLRPGMMITMEYDGTRVDIRVDNKKIVLAVTCG